MSETVMTLQDSDVIALVEMIWSTSLGLEIHPLEPVERKDWALPAIEAQVHIAGTWQGVVVLHTSETLAGRIAQVMFNLGTIPPTAGDVEDAFGEVANITGGNVKGLLSEAGAHLSLPAVVRGHDYAVHVPNSQQLVRLEFLSEGEPLVVTVLRASPTEASGNRHKQRHSESWSAYYRQTSRASGRPTT